MGLLTLGESMMQLAQSGFLIDAERATMLAMCVAATCFVVWFLVGLTRESRRVKRNRLEQMHSLSFHTLPLFTSIAPSEEPPAGNHLESRNSDVKVRKHDQNNRASLVHTDNAYQRQKHTGSEGLFKVTGMLMLVLVVGLPVLAQSAVDGNTGNSPNDEVRQLRALVEQLQTRVAQLEAQQEKKQSSEPALNSVSGNVATATAPSSGSQLLTQDDRSTLEFLHDTTLNFTFDGYYGYNFNRPVGRVNLLRAYDVSSNSFSINQATVILERAPDPSNGRRFGARLDLQYGQATETLQGNAANEPRPQAYRPIFQAYGTYVAPVLKGLTIDFGKFASAMGYEGNYNKDQFNYSRAYFFNFLPFYHMGFRNTLQVNDKLSLGYWLINGVQQTEDFNGFKSHVVQVVVKPTKTVQWNLIYHVGREQRDLVPDLNPGLPTLPTQPGLSTTPVVPIPDGRFHLVDSYVSWSVTPKLTLVGEGDYVINRQFEHSAPLGHVSGGAGYIHYQATPKVGLTARTEYLSDRGGLFSGVTQALKETTLTYEYKIADGLISRVEWRRDFSNQPFFLTETPNVLKKEQNTATLGLIWWWGRKSGSW
jgi:Putative beta-barrel porin-2, OmpL-like. bbp2